MEDTKAIKFKSIFRLSVILISVFILFIIFYYSSRIGKVSIKIKYAPFISNVYLDGKKINNNSEQLISPGEYSLKVSLDGFDTIEETVNVYEDTEYIYGSLQPNSPSGEELKLKYSKDYAEVEGIVGIIASKEGQKEREQNPILDVLPYKNSLFSLGYTFKGDNLTITVHSSRTYLSSALEKLKELSSMKKLIYYDIDIVDFKNDFDPFKDNPASNPKKFLSEGLSSSSTFSITDGEESNNFYYTTILTGSEESYNLLSYKIILKKQADSWILAGGPDLFLNHINTSQDVPDEVLINANLY